MLLPQAMVVLRRLGKSRSDDKGAKWKKIELILLATCDEILDIHVGGISSVSSDQDENVGLRPSVRAKNLCVSQVSPPHNCAISLCCLHWKQSNILQLTYPKHKRSKMFSSSYTQPPFLPYLPVSQFLP